MLDLARSRRENEFEVELKTQIMALINALLKFGAGAWLKAEAVLRPDTRIGRLRAPSATTLSEIFAAQPG